MQGKESRGVCVVGSDWGSNWAGGLVRDFHLGRHGEGQSEEVTLWGKSVADRGKSRSKHREAVGPQLERRSGRWPGAQLGRDWQIMGFSFGEAMVGFKQGSDML